MCEFCHKHGEGKKWYLQAKNYSDDLTSDLARRRFIVDCLAKPNGPSMPSNRMRWTDNMPKFVRSALTPYKINMWKKNHYGQVLPIEDIERIFDFVGTVVRMQCICRQKRACKEVRFCYGLSIVPGGGEFFKIINGIDVSYVTGPDTSGLEKLTKEEALENFREYEREGLCHSVWTFVTPFIGGICNCDRSDCGAMKATIMQGFPLMFRAEYFAQVNPELCNGCRACMRVCQFGAIGYSASNKKAVIDQGRCYGCGICRASCAKNAITLNDRSSVPALANRW
jgi:ferredoxin